MSLTGTRIEFHILQSFPVTCLNRDDVGAPKSALIGGVSRARVSSQCWKRQVRLSLRDLGVRLGIRTKHAAELIAMACISCGATEEQARACANVAAALLVQKNSLPKKQKKQTAHAAAAPLVTETLLFFSESEAAAIAEYARDNAFDPGSIEVKKSGKSDLAPKLKKLVKSRLNPVVDGLDIALFGRMVANAPDLNIQAAASFAHAISTHRVANEVEFFTALDDEQQEPGSAHMGSLEFNSATYYRYISLDLGQLSANLHGRGLTEAVTAFVKALYLAVPSARQTTQTGLRPWDYARIQIRKGQGMQVSFDEPVKAKDGFLKPSIAALDEALKRQEQLSGSLFGKIEDFTFGKDLSFTIDNLVEALAAYVRPYEAEA